MWIQNPLSTSPTAFPIIECIHIGGFGFSIGMTALVDFRLLGFGLQKQTAAEIARAFDGWMLAGLIVAVFSGLLLFSTDPDMYYLNWSFLIKMACLLLAIAFNYTIQKDQTATFRYRVILFSHAAGAEEMNKESDAFAAEYK